MAENTPDFEKLFAENAASKQEWTDSDYLTGWGYLGQVPPPYQLFDALQRKNDEKLKWLWQRNKNIHQDVIYTVAAHNNDRTAHLPMVGATTTAAGQRGIVPAPAAGAMDRFLCADATWKKASMTTLELVNVIYPVGIIVSFAAEFNPNEAWAGTTWEQMEAGRVLISAGTYTENGETYTYTLGDKGGEAKHQLTVGEMPAHNHDAVLESADSHTHTVPVSNRTGAGGGLIAGPQIGFWDTSAAGEHTHEITISSMGNNIPHNNMQPYAVSIMWRRTV